MKLGRKLKMSLAVVMSRPGMRSRMDCQAKARQALLNSTHPGPQGGLVLRKKREIIHVSQVCPAAQFAFYKVVKSI